MTTASKNLPTAATEEEIVSDVTRNAGPIAAVALPAKALGRLRSRAVQFVLGVGVVLALLVAPATSASAWTSSSIGVAAATDYGFRCDATYNTLTQNWPKISVRSATLQNIYVRTFLYRWNGATYVHTQTSQWYVGVSDVGGSHILGYTAGYAPIGHRPYYFAIPGRPSLVPSVDGYSFTGLTNGYYTTVQQYYAAGKYWNAQSSYASYSTHGGTPLYCGI